MNSKTRLKTDMISKMPETTTGKKRKMRKLRKLGKLILWTAWWSDIIISKA
jgi:hypothetical protein